MLQPGELALFDGRSSCGGQIVLVLDGPMFVSGEDRSRFYEILVDNKKWFVAAYTLEELGDHDG